MNVKLLGNIKWRLLGAYILVCLVGILGYVYGSPINYIQLFLAQYEIITVFYGIGVISLCGIHYPSMKGSLKQYPEELVKQDPLSFLGPFPNFILRMTANILIFYSSLIVLFHIFNGTFSINLVSPPNIFLGMVMSYLLYRVLSQTLDIAIKTFYER